MFAADSENDIPMLETGLKGAGGNAHWFTSPNVLAITDGDGGIRLDEATPSTSILSLRLGAAHINLFAIFVPITLSTFFNRWR